MPGPDRDEFFVGYVPAMPPQHGRAVRRFVGALALFTLGMAVMLVSLMKRPAAAAWDQGIVTLTGTLLVRPYPAIFANDPSGGEHAVLVVAPRKFGARGRLAPLDGAMVSLRGTLLRRESLTLIELEEDVGAAVRLGEGVTPARIDGGATTLRGEIIDPKCYCGAMKPGEGKVHRDCAVRCISGGIPPVLAVSGAGEGQGMYLLVGQNGEPLHDSVLSYVSERTEARGRLVTWGDLTILVLDADGLRRLE